MKGNEKILAKLNDLLSDELTAINQYMVHSEMAADWGYEKLHGVIEKRAIDEMKHAEMLIGRILFLEGTPIVSNLKAIHIGDIVEKQISNLLGKFWVSFSLGSLHGLADKPADQSLLATLI